MKVYKIAPGIFAPYLTNLFVHHPFERKRTTQTALKKSHPTIYALIQINGHSSVAMREAGDSPFMALPTELRCQIYSYLPDIAYEPIFPEPIFPEPGICSCEVYRMPTAILQLNKTIYEEVKHPSIQKPIQKANDQLLPRIVLGPTRTEIDPVYIALSHSFHWAGVHLYTFLNGPKNYGNERIENIGLYLDTWYNNTSLIGRFPGRYEDDFVTPAGCMTERLDRFVRQTLKRMVNRKTSDIRFRILVHPFGPLPARRNMSGDRFSNYTFYDSVAALAAVQRARGNGTDREYHLAKARTREVTACLASLCLYCESFTRSDSPVPSLRQY